MGQGNSAKIVKKALNSTDFAMSCCHNFETAGKKCSVPKGWLNGLCSQKIANTNTGTQWIQIVNGTWYKFT